MTVTNLPNSVQQLNLALAAALGVGDAKHVARVRLTLQPGALPLVEVDLRLRNADGLQEVVNRYRLAPQADLPPEADRDAA